MSDSLKTKAASGELLRVTNGYPVKFEHLTRLLQVSEESPSKRLSARDLSVSLGISTTHTQFLCITAQALGLMVSINHKPTAMGSLVVRADPFFDDLGTLWFLHYSVASDRKHIVWARFAQEIVPALNRFDLQQLRDAFEDLRTQFTAQTYTRHIQGETRSILNAYTEQQFSRLAYLREDGGKYLLSYREPIPPLVVAACIARFRDRFRARDTALSIAELLESPNSPGHICQIPEDRFRAALEALRSEPGFALESRADLDQVRLTDGTSDHAWMERHYASR